MFDARDWYWFVGGDTSQVYSSKKNIYVPNLDKDYMIWQQTSGTHTPPNAANESDLWYYVQSLHPSWMWDGTKISQPGLGLYSKSQLHNYNTNVRDTRMNGGMIATGIPVATDTDARSVITEARAQAKDNPNYTIQWHGSDGNYYSLDANGTVALSDAVAAHTTACYAAHSTVDPKIDAGTVTTLAQVDAAYVGL